MELLCIRIRTMDIIDMVKLIIVPLNQFGICNDCIHNSYIGYSGELFKDI